jgi:hypothetical protein
MLMWLSIGAWLPILLVAATISTSLPAELVALLFFLVLLGPLAAALWFRERATIGRAIGGEVSADGEHVSFPAAVFPLPIVVPVARSVPPDDPAAFFGG